MFGCVKARWHIVCILIYVNNVNINLKMEGKDMKKSELKIVDQLRLTPKGWGEPYVMVDEAMAIQTISDSFETESIDPDDDPNDLPKTVDLATDNDGNYYIISIPYEGTSWGHKTGEIHNENLYMPIEDPNECTQGLAEFLANQWSLFDDETD